MSRFTYSGYKFVAAGLATRAKARLYNLKTTPNGAFGGLQVSSNDTIETTPLQTPITDLGYWENRYALTELTLQKLNEDKLVINDAVISLSKKKHIVETLMQGEPEKNIPAFTVKEYISSGDYNLTIKIGIVATDALGNIVDKYPAEGIERLKSFLDYYDHETGTGLNVYSRFLDIFEIDEIIVTEYSINQETHSNRQTIDIKAISNNGFEIDCRKFDID